MTTATNMTPPYAAPPHNTARLGVNDPLLQELWAVKAKMNAEADYSIHELAEQARQFDLEATLRRLRQLANNRGQTMFISW